MAWITRFVTNEEWAEIIKFYMEPNSVSSCERKFKMSHAQITSHLKLVGVWRGKEPPKVHHDRAAEKRLKKPGKYVNLYK
jgi:hypothetical protein